ncbi:hypothetical protein AX16_001661 [Volvariella volvacea WC 439]|nr:hypothetical protein AX16_001661 [Volvariella volvacea WC 439]
MAAPAYTSKIEATPLAPLPPFPDPPSYSPPKYHPLFDDPDADVVLRSLEGTLYCVHSYILRNASGLFSTMFELPQPLKHGIEMGCFSAPEIAVYEPDSVLERLLRMVCGLAVPLWESYDDVERVLAIAEKWDAPGPIAIIRSALMSPKFLKADPLRLYALARHFGWKEQAKLAATESLTMALHDPEHTAQLERLSSKDLLPLLNLHRRRRDMFKELVDSPERFTAGNRCVRAVDDSLGRAHRSVDPFSSPYHCSRCGVTQLDNHTWRELKNVMFVEMDRRPLGDTLGIMAGIGPEWPEALACWEAKCKKEGCGGLNYDRVATIRQIRNCIDLLPITIEDEDQE